MNWMLASLVILHHWKFIAPETDGLSQNQDLPSRSREDDEFHGEMQLLMHNIAWYLMQKSTLCWVDCFQRGKKNLLISMFVESIAFKYE